MTTSWPGLAYVLEYGLPGFPPPRVQEPSEALRAVRAKAGRASGAARQTTEFGDS